MTDGSGPGAALIVLLVVVGILVLAMAGLVVTRRRAPRVEEPEAAAPPAPPREAPPVEPPEVIAPPEVEAPPPPPPPEVIAPPEVEAPPPPPPPAEIASPEPEAPPPPPPPEVIGPPEVEAPPPPAEIAPPEVEAPPPPPPPAEIAPPEVEAPPTPPEPQVPVPPAPWPAPPTEAPAPPKRARIRSIGASLSRLFRGTVLTPEDWDDLEEILLRADVGVAATERIVSSLRRRKDVMDGPGALREELLEVLGTPDRSLKRKAEGLTVWLVTGVNGTGKTTTIGKLASQLRDEGASVVLAAADTFRAAADEQLERWGEMAGATVIKHQPGGDPAAVVFDSIAAARARGAGYLIVDTAGRLQTKRNLMEELSKIRRILEREAGEPDEVLLVLDATTGQNGVQQARAFSEAVSVTGLALTKLDGTAKGGIVIAVQQELGIPVKLVGIGEGIGDLAPFDPQQFVDELVGP